MSAGTATATRTPFQAKVHWMECCNCQHGCNCQFEGRPNEGKCEFLIGFEVIDGRFGDVDLGGTRFVVGAKYPGAIHEGNGSVVLFVDESASPEQTDAIASILSGRHGGMPWEALATTISSFAGPVRAPVEMHVEGRRSRFRVPGYVDVQLTPLRDVVSGAEKDVHIVYPKGGFFWNDGHVCTTETMTVEHDAMRFEHPGRYSAYAVASWTNQT